MSLNYKGRFNLDSSLITTCLDGNILLPLVRVKNTTKTWRQCDVIMLARPHGWTLMENFNYPLLLLFGPTIFTSRWCLQNTLYRCCFNSYYLNLCIAQINIIGEGRINNLRGLQQELQFLFRNFPMQEKVICAWSKMHILDFYVARQKCYCEMFMF